MTPTGKDPRGTEVTREGTAAEHSANTSTLHCAVGPLPGGPMKPPNRLLGRSPSGVEVAVSR